MIQTGGTLGQEKGQDGVYRPSDKDYLDKVPEIHQLADITVERPANIDSTNMETTHRAMLAKKIYENYNKYDGFVIVHGTDTMADTASALNYMIQKLGKPVVLTGSQISIFEPESDAPKNLYNAVKTATMDIGEVVITFGDKIVRGNRAIKEDEKGFNAFSSPRVPPVGKIGLEITLENHRIRRYEGKPKLFTEFDTGIEFYQQTSGSQSKVLTKYADDDSIEGLVIGGFGAGNIQGRLIPSIERIIESGKPVVVTTICPLGSAEMGIYEVGSTPLKAGAISAIDMTREAATQKLMYALGLANKITRDTKEKISIVKEIIHQEYAGDISK